jgi:hypothetical protein
MNFNRHFARMPNGDYILSDPYSHDNVYIPRRQVIEISHYDKLLRSCEHIGVTIPKDYHRVSTTYNEDLISAGKFATAQQTQLIKQAAELDEIKSALNDALHKVNPEAFSLDLA